MFHAIERCSSLRRMWRSCWVVFVATACASSSAPPDRAPTERGPAPAEFFPTRTEREQAIGPSVDGGADAAQGGSDGERPELPLVPANVQTLYESESSGPSGLAADADHVYFANECAGTIARLSKRGGVPEIIAEKQLRPTAVGVDEGNVYFLSEGRLGKLSCDEGHELCDLDRTPRAKDGALLSVPKSGGKPRTLARGLHHPVHLAVDADSILVAEAGSRRLVAVPKTKGALRVLAAAQEHISRVAVGPDAYFWLDGTPKKLRRHERTPEVIDSYWSQGLAVDGDFVYVHHADRVSRISHAGTEVSAISPELSQFTPPIAAEGGHVWWSHCARISKAPIEGGPSLSVYAVEGTSCRYYRGGSSGVSRDIAPREIVVDSGSVFWLENQHVNARPGEQYHCEYSGSVKRIDK